MPLPGAPAVPAAGSRDPTVPRPVTPERAYWAVLADGMLSRTMEVLTSGAVLAALALSLGANGVLLGLLLAVVPALGQLAQLPGVWWIRRTGRVKGICLGLVLPARVLLLAAAGLAFFRPDLGALALVPLVAAASLFANMSGVAWSVWMNELLPRERLGRFYGTRLALMAAAGLLALGASALYLHETGRGAQPLALVYAVGAVAGLAGAVFIARIPARQHTPAPGSSLHPVHALRRAPAYRRMLPALVTLSAGLNLFLPFSAAVLLLGGAYSEAVTLGLVAWSKVVALLAFPLLGRVSDARGHAPVVAFGALLLGAAALGWMLTAHAAYPLWAVALLYSAHGLGSASLDLAIGNLQMWLAPRGEAPALFAGTAILRALAAAGAGAIAGALLPLTAGGMPHAWVAGGLLCAVAGLWIGRMSREPGSPTPEAPAPTSPKPAPTLR